jgi:hypothetical protein
MSAFIGECYKIITPMGIAQVGRLSANPGYENELARAYLTDALR